MSRMCNLKQWTSKRYSCSYLFKRWYHSNEYHFNSLRIQNRNSYFCQMKPITLLCLQDNKCCNIHSTNLVIFLDNYNERPNA